MKLRQVALRSSLANGYTEDIAWIDNEKAKKGKQVIDENNMIWTVAELYGARESDELETEYKTWRYFADKLDGH